MTKAISEAELVSRRAIRSLYEGRPLTNEEKVALRELVWDADHGLKYQGDTIPSMIYAPPWEVSDK